MKKVLVLLICMFSFVPLANAESNNYFSANENLKISKDKKFTSFIAGNTVSLENEIDGIGFIAGNMVNVSGKQDYSFIAGNSVTVKELNVKDAFIAGNTITLDSDIQRDVFIAGNIINTNGKIGRNLFVAGSKIIINGIIEGDVYIDSEDITIDNNAVINGTLKYNDNSKVVIAKDAKVGKTKVYKSVSNNNKKFVNNLYDIFQSFSNILVIGLLLMFLFKKIFNKISNIPFTTPTVLSNFGIGLLFLVVVPIISLILFVTIMGMSAGFILTAIYVIFIYLSSIFSSYYFANNIIGEKVNNEYTTLIIGLALVYFIRLVPFVGSIVSMIVLFVGLGILYKLTYEFIKLNKGK